MMSSQPNTFHLRSIGSFHIGGAVAELRDQPSVELVPVPGSPAVRVDTNGAFPYGQMYVQYARLATPRSPYPLFLWHGGGMTGACWESTPDGRPGWQSFFLRAGLDVFVCDAVERGRAGWARFPQIYPSEPFFMPQHAAWEIYRVGPVEGYSADASRRTGFDGGLFPLHAFDDFTRQIVPRWQCNGALVQDAYDELLAAHGPCILLAHSQGAGFALAAAAKAPERIKALVLVEPGGSPVFAASDFARLARVPVLIVWGDHLDAVPYWAAAREKADALAQGLNRAGGDATTLDLPACGVRGNSHLLMMDANSDEVAGHVERWLVARRIVD